MIYPDKRIPLYALIFVIVLLYASSFCTGEAMDKSQSEPNTASDWCQNAMMKIRDMEYEVSWQENSALPGGKAGYHIVNRQQDLRLYFYPEGVKAIRRSESKPSWILGWTLSGISRS